MIYHVTTKKVWENALQQGFFEAASLAEEGFIHCSSWPQIAAVLDRYYKNEPDLLLLHIEETLLSSPLKFELAPSVNELFPHIFGPINLNAVVEVITIQGSSLAEY